MKIIKGKLTVLFEEPFWIGVYERESDGEYEVCKVTFGAEPRDYEVYAFMLGNFTGLRFSPAIAGEEYKNRKINPKRIQRVVQKQVQDRGIGTKAQQALKLQQEQGKLERHKVSREQIEIERQRQFLMRREKQKEKHRGH